MCTTMSTRYLHRLGQRAPDASKLVDHRHDHLAAKAVPNEHLWKQLEAPDKLEHVCRSRLHTVGATRWCSTTDSRFPVAAQVHQQYLP